MSGDCVSVAPSPFLPISPTPTADPEREARAERVAQTGKYDRKAIRARLDLEQWLDERLASVMGDDADAVDELEIDLDEVSIRAMDEQKEMEVVKAKRKRW